MGEDSDRRWDSGGLEDSGRLTDSGRLKRLDVWAARRWAVATRSAFAAHRAEIDDLNVFPVPDGDTGTNLYITLDSALGTTGGPGGSGAGGKGVHGTLADDAATLARATLLAARGNSGVILSQLVRGLSEVVAEAAALPGDGTDGRDVNEGLDGPTLARAVRRASDRAYASVTRPVEGTILSVAAAAATAAEQAAGPSAELYDVAHASLAAARLALAATTAQLPVLARAGVVDAGGLGYVLVLEALERVIVGESLVTATSSDVRPEGPVRLGREERRAVARSDGDGVDPMHSPNSVDSLSSLDNLDGLNAADRRQTGTPSYEVMYLLSGSDDEAVARLRDRLDELGDSVLVVGGGDLWNVHVHVDDVGAAIQAGIEAGKPHRLEVTHFADRERAKSAQSARSEQVLVTAVACAAGEGLAEVFRTAGAVPVFNGPGRRASAGRLLDAIRSAGSHCVIVLPNDGDTLLAAQAASCAAAEAGLEVHVVPSRSAIQGIAALAVFEPTATGADNLAAMSGAAAATREGAVTVAGGDALTSVGWCHRGDVLGVVDGEVIVVGQDVAEVGMQVVARLLDAGGEMLTVVHGAGGGPDLSAVVAKSARAGRREVEVNILEGGQARYPLLLGVE